MQKTRHDLTCRILTTEDEFENLAQAWTELFDHCSYPTPFCTWEWAWHWWQNLGVPDPLACQLRIVTVTGSDGRLRGIAPFYFPTRGGFPLRLRPFRLLGARLRCQGEDVTDEPILLLRAGDEQAVLGAVLAFLTEQNEPGWDIFYLRVMRRRTGPSLSSLWAAARSRLFRSGVSGICVSMRSTAGQYVALPESWAEFRRSLSKSMRDNLPYYPRLLTRHGHAWHIRTARTPAEIADAAEVLIALHGQRALSTAGTPHYDHLPTAQHKCFLSQTLTALAKAGRARIVLLEVAGVPIAAQAILEQHPLMQFYYSGFDPEWRAYSPITILNAHVMQEALERRVPLLDYLPGVEPWKTRWGAADLYIMEEMSWMPLRVRPLLRLARRSLARLWQRRFGFTCDCGFCGLRTPSTPVVQPKAEPKRRPRSVPVL